MLSDEQAAALVARLKAGLVVAAPGVAPWRYLPPDATAAPAAAAADGEEEPAAPVGSFALPGRAAPVSEEELLALVASEELVEAEAKAALRLAESPALGKAAREASKAAGIAVGDEVELQAVGGGPWTRCYISHIEAPEVTIVVEFAPMGAEDEGNPRAYYAEQNAGVGETITLPKNALRSAGSSQMLSYETATVVAAMADTPMLRLCSAALKEFPTETQPAEYAPADSTRVRRLADGLPLPAGARASALIAEGVVLTALAGASAEAVTEAVEGAPEGAVNLPVRGLGAEADAAGRLPLHWAVIAEDVKAVNALLQMEAAVSLCIKMKILTVENADSDDRNSKQSVTKSDDLCDRWMGARRGTVRRRCTSPQFRARQPFRTRCSTRARTPSVLITRVAGPRCTLRRVRTPPRCWRCYYRPRSRRTSTLVRSLGRRRCTARRSGAATRP